MIALLHFIIILVCVLSSRRYFTSVIDKIKKDLEQKKQQKIQLEREYEIKQQQKRVADKTPYEIKLDEIKKLEVEIQDLKREAEQYNNTDSYVKYSKFQRQILKLNQQLEKDRLGLDELKQQDNQTKRTSNNSNNEEEKQWRQHQLLITQEISILVNEEPSTKQKERIINGFMPVVFIFIFSNFPVLLQTDISKTLWPLSNLIGDQINEFTAQIGNIVWVFVQFRVISIFHDYFIKKPKSKFQEEKKEY